MTEDKDVGSVGVGLFGMLGLVLVALRLSGVIDWPWLVVLAPIWVPVAFVVAFLAILLAVAYLAVDL